MKFLNFENWTNGSLQKAEFLNYFDFSCKKIE